MNKKRKLFNSKYTHHELYKSIIFVNEFMLLHDRVQIRGIKLLANLEGGSFNHFRNLDRRAMKMWGKTTGKTIPLRLKKMALINVSTLKLGGSLKTLHLLHCSCDFFNSCFK
jgi:hypothetical protein